MNLGAAGGASHTAEPLMWGYPVGEPRFLDLGL